MRQVLLLANIFRPWIMKGKQSVVNQKQLHRSAIASTFLVELLLMTEQNYGLLNVIESFRDNKYFLSI